MSSELYTASPTVSGDVGLVAGRSDFRDELLGGDRALFVVHLRGARAQVNGGVQTPGWFFSAFSTESRQWSQVIPWMFSRVVLIIDLLLLCEPRLRRQDACLLLDG